MRWLRLGRVSDPTRGTGIFLAFEGGDGAGKSTQVRLLAERLEAAGREVVVTRQPGGTALGQQLRDLVLHGAAMSPRAEALIFAADKAQHVSEVVAPALDRGAVVITDRYTDSSVAYQGAGRELGHAEVHDRMESEGDGFHEAVRSHFLATAQGSPERYLVVDGTAPPEQIHAAILDGLESRGVLR